MATQKRQKVIEARVTVEADDREMERVMNFVTQQLQASCRLLRGGAVVISLYDDDGVMIAMNTTGVISEGLQYRLEGAVGDDQKGVRHAS